MVHIAKWQFGSQSRPTVAGRLISRRCSCCILAAAPGQLDRRQRKKSRTLSKSLSALNVKNAAGGKQAEAPTCPEDDLKSVVGALENSLGLGSPPADTSSIKLPSIPEEFRSTLSHRIITGGTVLLISALMAKGILEIEGPQDFAAGLVAALFGYYLSDFLTGIYHWGVDNYGDGSTPIVGSQIEAFQGHHQKPWTITQRQFCNNLHKVFLPVAPWTAFCLLISPITPSWLDIGLATATFLTAMSQQFHAWAHTKPSDLPEPVKALQDAGVLVSRKAHGAHHKAPFEGNYCIVSGFWNPILDQDGSDSSFFRSLERFVRDQTNVEPRCWYEPDYTWQEE